MAMLRMERAYYCLFTCLTAVLCACGGGSGSNNSDSSTSATSPTSSATTLNDKTESTPLDKAFNRIWHLGNEEFILVSTDKVMWMSPDSIQDCYRLETFDVESSSDSSLTLNSESINPQVDFQSLSENQADIEFQGAQYSAVATAEDFLEFEPSQELCNANTSATKIRSEINLVEVPEMVKVDRNASAMTTTELDWVVTFDINDSEKIDAGDISIRLSNTKSAAKTESIVPITDLQARLMIFTSADMGYSILNEIDVSASSSELSLSVNTATHPLLSLITENTGVFARATTFYKNPEVDELWSGAADGPWNWVSSFHKDSLPDREDSDGDSQNIEDGENFAPIYQINAMPDAVNDYIGEADWVDIIGLQIQLES